MNFKMLFTICGAFTAIAASAQEGCIQNFDSAPNAITLGVVTAFGQDNFAGEAVVWNPNPDMKGNSTDSVLQFTKAGGGQFFAGFTFQFPKGRLEIPEEQPQTLTLQVWGPREGQVVVKIEPEGRPQEGTGNIFPINGDLSVPRSWRTLTYNIPPGADGSNLTIIPGIDEAATTDEIWYVDNISYGTGDCGNTAATRTPRAEVAVLTASPNPARSSTDLTLTAGTSRVRLLDAVGRVVRTQDLRFGASDGQRLRLDLAGLATGSYLAVGEAADGTVLGRARLVVEQ